MRLKRYITEAKGSYLDNKKMPKEGQEVYALVGFERKIVKGKIRKLTNIDNKGLANTYLDINSGGKNYHVDISQVYDHKPKQVKTKDEYGDVTIWENIMNFKEYLKNDTLSESKLHMSVRRAKEGMEKKEREWKSAKAKKYANASKLKKEYEKSKKSYDGLNKEWMKTSKHAQRR